ncbi:MAG: hypothetical protein H6R07_790 [Proteobacteria bacterium]|nr:hypothetical protein [Pseudomonadota bacterium]
MDANLLTVVESDTNLEVRAAAGLLPVRPVASEPVRVAGAKVRIPQGLPGPERNNPAGVGGSVDVWV